MSQLVHYKNRRVIEAELSERFFDGTCYIQSVENWDRGSVAGTTCIATLENAARCIVERTHRVATDDEIAAYLDHQERNRRASQATTDRFAKSSLLLFRENR